MAATAEQYANWITKNADKRGTKEFDTVARAYEQAKTMSVAGAGQPKTPDWAKESPGLYSAASTARDVLGPAVEIALPTAGAVLGMKGGPYGVAAGAGLGEGIAGELMYGADVALGRREPRSVMESVTEPISNVAFGATTEVGAGKVLDFAGRKIGGLIDAARGVRTDIKARNLLRDSITTSGASPQEQAKLLNALRTAPADLTARQAGAGAEGGGLFQALGARAEQQRSVVDSYPAIIGNRIDNDVANIAELAGGVTNTDLRAAQDAARKQLNVTTGPQREAAIGRAKELGGLEPALRAEASALEDAAATAAEDLRRFAAANDRARVRANQTDPNVWSQQYENYMRQGIPDLAEQRMKQAADGSLEFGQAARFAESAADSLKNAGLVPLEGQKIADTIRAMTKDPRFAAMSERNIALNRVAQDIEQWTNAQGIIDADALDSIRKNAVNSIFQTTNLTPKAKAKAVAQTMNEIRPFLVDAMENAGGAGYRQYLENYSRGMNEIARKELFGTALDLYRTNPAKFVKLVDGDAPKIVEKTLGYKNYDIAEAIGEEGMEVLRNAAQTIKRTNKSEELVKNTDLALEQLLRANLPLMRLPSFISFKAAIGNQVLSSLERKIGDKVLSRLGTAFKSGKSATDLLDSLTAYERFQVMSAIDDPQIAQMLSSGAKFGATTAVNELAADSPPPQNQLAR
jgi:DNA-binding phage protein